MKGGKVLYNNITKRITDLQEKGIVNHYFFLDTNDVYEVLRLFRIAIFEKLQLKNLFNKDQETNKQDEDSKIISEDQNVESKSMKSQNN